MEFINVKDLFKLLKLNSKLRSPYHRSKINKQFTNYLYVGLDTKTRIRYWESYCAHLCDQRFYDNIKDKYSEYDIDIKNDLERTFPKKLFFKPNLKTLKKLKGVLNAFSLYRPDIGYC